MSYIFIFLLFGAFLHFIYESILAPSFRLKLRFELFALRDELRRLKIARAEELDNKHFNYLQNSLNTIIAFLPRYDLATLAAVEREFRRNPEIEKRIEERIRVLDDCDIPQMRSIRDRSLTIAAKAIATNNGGWGIYILPIALPVLGLSRLKRLIKATLSFSEPDLEKVTPFSAYQTASLV